MITCYFVTSYSPPTKTKKHKKHFTMNIYHSLYIQDGDFKFFGRRCVREKVTFVSKEIKDYFNHPKMFLLLVVYLEDRVW